MKFRKEYTCPLEIVHDIIKGKWKTVIIWNIHFFGKITLADLQRSINGISQKMLMQHLKELHEYELIDKIKHEGYPLKVEYVISEDKGKKLIKALDILQELGQEYLKEINKEIKR
jgi:DNA-binding HxlR family transcriptional regulator